ncbi:MAG: hypothetical protein AAGC60_03135 [Acidobacteriota bacterium]
MHGGSVCHLRSASVHLYFPADLLRFSDLVLRPPARRAATWEKPRRGPADYPLIRDSETPGTEFRFGASSAGANAEANTASVTGSMIKGRGGGRDCRGDHEHVPIENVPNLERSDKEVTMPKSSKFSVLLVLAAMLAAGPAFAGEPVAWSDEASEELAVALHEMHEVWNTGDIESLKKLIIGDDVLVTFELDPATHTPIRINSRDQLWSFVDNIVTNLEDEEAVSLLGHPGVHCRATDSFGVCTEECNVTVKLPNGVEERHKLWSTATAVKYPDGWKWIQWHMSTGGPVEVYQNGVKVVQGD